MRTRTLVLVGLLVSLLVAGGVSYYASSNPDGLEYVAEEVGFAGAAEEHAGADGPLADYRVRGIEDGRLSGGLAGVVGALAVLLLSGGLALVLRRPSGPKRRDEAAKPVVPDHSPADRR